MKAACVLEFGPPGVITIDDLARPKPSSGQVLVRVRAAGVGPWDVLVRTGRSDLNQPLPLILGSELSGIVEAVGNVGAYAVQLASHAGLHVVATAAAADLEFVKSLGAKRVVDYRTTKFEDSVSSVDVVIDTVGGDTQQRSLSVLKPGGILVSVVSKIPEKVQQQFGVRAAFFYVEVTTGRLNKIAELFDEGSLVPHVGTVLPLAEARTAHEMLGGAPHKRGKIVLQVAA
jgi:NADPH:quinone reductase-like Zn-dependent oxidoreductase